MRILLLIIRKFLSSAKDKNDISKLSFFSYILVALSVAVPILVLSVTNGFQGMVEHRIVQYDFHLRISGPRLLSYGEIPSIQGLEFWGYYEDKCLIRSHTTSKISQVRAFSQEDYGKAPFVKNYQVVAGSAIPQKGGIVLAENLAANLRVGIGDEIHLTAIDHSIGYNRFSGGRYRVDGILTLGYGAYDTTASFLLKEDADQLFLLAPSAINRIGVFIESENYRQKAFFWERNLSSLYPEKIVINTFSNKVFRDFEEEKKSLTVSMLVIILIAFIAIFITLNVVLADKFKDVALLQVVGLSQQSLVRIFLGQGVFIAFVGACVGFFLGAFLVINLEIIIRFFEMTVNNLIYWSNLAGITDFPSYYRYEIMPRDIFYLSSLPYQLILRDFLIQSMGVFVLSLIAAFSPTLKMRKANPAEIFRNE